MTNPVRWGILGASKFALNQMAPAIHSARRAELVALATRDASRAAPFSAFCPGLRVHESYEALLADPGIDAVYIPLPNTLHVEWSEKAMRAGKHVLCEKPIAMAAGDIDRLIALRDETGLFATEAYMIVHHPQWQRARALVQEGAIGEVLQVNGVFSYNNPDPGNIRNQAGTGGGGMPDIGVYPIGATRFVTGLEPEGISARLTLDSGVDVKAEMTARFGAAAFFTMVSMRMQPYQEMLFHGTEGFIRLSVPFNPLMFGEARIDWRQGGGPTMTETWPAAQHYVNQVEAVAAAIQDGADYPWTLEDAQGTQAVLDQVFAVAERV